MKSLTWSVLLGLVFVIAAPAAEKPRVRPDFGIVFNDDADLSFVLPDRARSEALLRANISALADTPVKTLVYCIGMGGDLLYYNTKIAAGFSACKPVPCASACAES